MFFVTNSKYTSIVGKTYVIKHTCYDHFFFFVEYINFLGKNKWNLTKLKWILHNNKDGKQNKKHIKNGTLRFATKCNWLF